jgi:hypothetical protein
LCLWNSSLVMSGRYTDIILDAYSEHDTFPSIPCSQFPMQLIFLPISHVSSCHSGVDQITFYIGLWCNLTM